MPLARDEALAGSQLGLQARAVGQIRDDTDLPQATFKLGNGLFRKLWVSSPSSTQASDGLGPLFNARACQSCHLKDGRGHPPETGGDSGSMLLRLARAASAAERDAMARREVLNFPDPVYGGQLQELAVPGLAAEGEMAIAYEEEPVRLGDSVLRTSTAGPAAIAVLSVALGRW